MPRRISRRRLARAAIERLESQRRGAQYIAEGWEKDAIEAQRREVEANADREQALQRLADANAELRRWGLEPVTRDAAESREHPQRYRRSSDWRTFRSGLELVDERKGSHHCFGRRPNWNADELLERSNIDPDAPAGAGAAIAGMHAAAPPGVDVTVDDGDDAQAEPEARPEPEPDIGDLVFYPRLEHDLTAPVGERLDALRRQRDALSGALVTVTGERDAARLSEAECQDALAVAREDARRAQAELSDALTAASEAEGRLSELELTDPTAEALHAERTAREHADRRADRAIAQNLDLQRWRESERVALADFVNALADAAQRGTLHLDLVEPYERAAALLEDPDA